MCGIAGFIEPRPGAGDGELRALADAMAATLTHRGPDDRGGWTDAENGVALGHTRLSIIDLSAAGAQPMTSSCGRIVLGYNGEIYNAPELRKDLERAGRSFRGHSDTEVLAEACAEWGVEATLQRLVGMFAFAMWDRREKTLTLVRDRLGIKPLYWGRVGGRFVFASELKALRPLPDWSGEIDRQALAQFLQLSYVPAPHSIYKDIHKLEPGQRLTFRPGGEPEIRAYWSLADAARAGQRDPLDVSDAEAVDALEELLGDAVKRRMMADVPLGAFLSGGIDSSTVTALMQAAGDRPVRTFSIGFHESAYNEAVHAKAVAGHLGTEHTEEYVTAEKAREVIPRLPAIYDEPFADPSQIPTLLISEMTRRHVTVALSGDGGDELFAGYNRYAQGLSLARAARLLPARARDFLSRALLSVPPHQWDQLFRAVPEGRRPRLAGEKMHKLAAVLPEDEAGFYRELVNQWTPAWRLVRGAREPQGLYADHTLRKMFDDPVRWMQFLDTVTYLPGDILTKVDRASMAVSLEARVPILDHRVVEFAWRLPDRFRIRGGTSKWLLRQLLHRYVPEELVRRPKMGFAPPVGGWLRGPLKTWGRSLIDACERDPDRLLDTAPILEKWREHQSGRRNWQYFLWNVAMFQAWREAQTNRPGSPQGNGA